MNTELSLLFVKKTNEWINQVQFIDGYKCVISKGPMIKGKQTFIQAVVIDSTVFQNLYLDNKYPNIIRTFVEGDDVEAYYISTK